MLVPSLQPLILGTDATEAFEDVGHSAGAREMLKEYCIGEVTENESVKEERTCAISRGPQGQYQFSGCLDVLL